jgi:hypothetical protein
MHYPHPPNVSTDQSFKLLFKLFFYYGEKNLFYVFRINMVKYINKT